MSEIICVTGGSGLIGSRIVWQLLQNGFHVRVLSRSPQPEREGLEWFTGSLDDEELLLNFMRGASKVFHCAAELKNVPAMHRANVDGTHALFQAAVVQKVSTFCHLSTVGVYGLTPHLKVDEQSPCDPFSEYDKTKWEAEQIVLGENRIDNRIILRPANVFDEDRLLSLQWLKRRGIISRLRLLLQGRERPHLVHADDVAAAAIYLSAREISGVETFIVSYDDDPMSTYAGIHALVAGKTTPSWSLPAWLPFLLRFVVKGRAIRGDALYSSQKLLNSGFNFPSGLQRSVRQTLEQADS